jgi:hypothetical protein
VSGSVVGGLLPAGGATRAGGVDRSVLGYVELYHVLCSSVTGNILPKHVDSIQINHQPDATIF